MSNEGSQNCPYCLLSSIMLLRKAMIKEKLEGYFSVLRGS